MLTRKQRDLLLFIDERMKSGDIAPSFDEMKDALGLKSKSGIHRLINALVERGYLQRLPHRARALEVLRLPENTSAKPSLSEKVETLVNSVMVPLCGKIAAGTPIEAIQHEGDQIEIPPSLIGPGDHYALRVEGDSMKNAGIMDHDIAIICKCDSAENGAIVVALVDEAEATLKRLRRAGNDIHLIPENEDYETRILPANRVRIQGKLVSTLRTYH